MHLLPEFVEVSQIEGEVEAGAGTFHESASAGGDLDSAIKRTSGVLFCHKIILIIAHPVCVIIPVPGACDVVIDFGAVPLGIWSRVACRYPPPTPHGIPLQMVKTRNPREGRTFVSKVPTVTGMAFPEPGILVSVVTFEATQLCGVFKVATLSWLGHGFGLCSAQLLTLNPKPVQIYTPEP